MRFSAAKHGALLPADAEAKAFVEKLDVGAAVELSTAAPQSSFRRFVYAMLRRLEPFAPRDPLGRPANVRAYLTILTGWVTLIRRNGTPTIVPISLSDMTAAQFEAFWHEARLAILDQVLPPRGQNREADALRAELEHADAPARYD